MTPARRPLMRLSSQAADTAGLACDVCQHCLLLPTLNIYGCIPNYPNYFLGADTSSICDSLTSSITHNKLNFANTLSIFPNPATTSITITANGIKGNKVTISIYNAIGNLIRKQSVQAYVGKVTLQENIKELPSGIYIVKLETDPEGSGELYTSKFVKH